MYLRWCQWTLAWIFWASDSWAASIQCRAGRFFERSRCEKGQRLEVLKPLVWVHIPKTGTSFVNTLLFTACPEWPQGVAMDTEMERSGIPYLFQAYPLSKHCKGGFEEDYPAPREGGHYGLTEESYGLYAGRMVGMFRRPRDRVLSSFTQPGGPWGDASATNITQYVLKQEGCATKSLVRGGWYPCNMSSQPVSEREVSLAMKRLDGFAFIGLTEEWNLSVCLFHAMFGGELFLEELAVTRSSASSARLAATVELSQTLGSDWRDEADEKVHAAASRRFWSDIQKYNVSREQCSRHIPASRRQTSRLSLSEVPRTFAHRSSPSWSSDSTDFASKLAGAGQPQQQSHATTNAFSSLQAGTDGNATAALDASLLYSYSLASLMLTGDSVVVRAQGWGPALGPDNAFAISLRTLRGNIALSYGARDKDQMVVMNSKINNEWRAQKTVQLWPHGDSHKPFNISFTRSGGMWQTTVNGTRWPSLDYSYADLPGDPITRVEVSKNLKNAVVSLSHASFNI